MPLSETECITFATLRSENIKLFQNFPLCEGTITLVNHKVPSAAVISFFTSSLKLFRWQAHMPWEIIACIHIPITSNTPALSTSFLHWFFFFPSLSEIESTPITPQLKRCSEMLFLFLSFPPHYSFFFFKPKVCRMLMVNKVYRPLGNSA